MLARWITAPSNPERAEAIARFLGVSPIVGQLMFDRGIKTPQEAETYLTPKLEQLHNPQLMPNIDKAAERIKRAVLDKEPIMIFGDYDVDGITASATMYHALKHFGANVDVYIPDRIGEGYGLNEKAVADFCEKGVKLIITVDCGITAVGPAQVAREAGVDMIVTDHHEWQEAFPDCYTIVHPRLPGFSPAYPNPHICGAGVAFKVAWALGQQFSGENRVSPSYRKLLMQLMAFTALGTIADVVPLQGENRVIAHFGLCELPDSPFPGLIALIQTAHLGGKAIDGYHVGFCLAPRLNAAGRMGHALEALNMMISEDFNDALAVGEELERKNKSRQETEKAITAEAIREAELFPYAKITIVSGNEWHPGVVGIVASRLVERFYRPAIVLVDDGKHMHGSCRSIEGFNIATALGACKEYLVKYGGHAMAAGLKLESANLEVIRMALNDYADEHLDPDLLVPRLHLDADILLGEITVDLVKEIKRMGPFGQGNRRPLLCLRNAIIRNPETMGKEGKHLKFAIHHDGKEMKGLAFGKGDLAHAIPTGTPVDLAVEPTLNEFRGATTVELLVRDILPH